MRLVPLGTNGYFPSFGRQTMSFLVLTGRQVLLLDAGTGFSRLIEPEVAALVSGYRELDIVLSHYHVDHVIGLSYLPHLWPRGIVRIYGPTRPMVDAEPERALDQFMSAPLFSASFRSFPAKVEVIPIRETAFDIGDIRVRVWPQPHPGGSIGIRLDDDIAYLTDTTVDSGNVDFVRGVKLLLHELWLTDEEAAAHAEGGHSHLSAVASFARRTIPRALLPVHHQPKRSGEEIRGMCARIQELSGIPTLVAKEGRAVDFGG